MDVNMDVNKKLATQFGLKQWQVDNVVQLIDDDNTIPFIARYRKEMTGELSDDVLRDLYDRLLYLRQIEKRKQEVLRLIDEQGKLTDQLAAAVNACEKLVEIEDLYAPYKQKRRTRASVARERGLQPLSDILLAQNIYDGDPSQLAAAYIDAEKGVETVDDALAGAMDIIAEQVADNAEYKGYIRDETFSEGALAVKLASGAADSKKDVYQMYHDYSEPLHRMPHHRILAVNRGEKEGVLSVKLQADAEKICGYLNYKLVPQKRSVTSDYVEAAAADAYKRLIAPSVENELRAMLTDEAQEGAIKVFALNLKNLLLTPPLKNKVVLGWDPAYRTGCKLAVVDETGRVLDTAIIHPTPPQNRIFEAETTLSRLIEKHDVTVISIGNGTASRESEQFVASFIKRYRGKVLYTVTNESGASVYSASKLGAEEFPDFDPAQRSAVSIARRLQDPLAELVKIEPKAIGVGQYQHDINQKRLGEALGGVVEQCVNSVGVDVNTASAPLLSYVSGLSSAACANIIERREKQGRFKSRKEISKVPRIGKKTFTQCAGFLRIPDAEDVLDNTAVHPESYDAARKLLEITGYTQADVKNGKIADINRRIAKIGMTQVATQCGVGVPTLNDIAAELQKPGRDIRETVAPPALKADVLSIEDLKEGMALTGTVRNVVDFGAFVDIGVHQDGLVHISRLSDRFVNHPGEVVAVGDVVNVRVLEIDIIRNRIALTMV